MGSLNKIFFRGLVTLLPIAVTIYIVYSAVLILENLLGGLLRHLMPHYVPGLGFLFVLILIFIFGLMLNNFLTARLLGALEDQLTQVPFIRAIYSPLKDVMNLFGKKDQKALKHVVLVKFGDSGASMIGVITRDSFKDLNLPTAIEDKVAVYFPFSYALGGFTFLVPKNQVTVVDLPIEKAMSLAITAWVKVEPKKSTPEPLP